MPTRRLSPLPLAAVLVPVALLAIPTHLRPDNFIVDDGYFYPQIARFIAAGQGSTFNGWIPTNGYHPLWMLVCVAGAMLTRRAGALLQILLLVQDALCLATLGLLCAASRAAARRGWVLGAAPIVFFATVLGIWRLLEAPLALLLQLLVLAVTFSLLPAAAAIPPRLRMAVAGLLTGLTLLARLDLIFFAAAVLLWEAFLRPARISRAAQLLAAVGQGLIVTVVVAPYLAWNYTRFRHLTPISGAIKSTFPRPQWPLSIPAFAWPVLFAIAFSLLLLARRKKTALEPLDRATILAGMAAALHLAYTLLFGGLAPWYLTTGYLALALAGISILDAGMKRLRIPVTVEAAAAALIFFLFAALASARMFSDFSYTRALAGRAHWNPGYVEPKRALAGLLRQRLPAEARIFIFDAPGGVAYYSGLSLLPADGLTADYQYNRDLEQMGFARYAAEHHIDYLVMPLLAPGQRYGVEEKLLLSGEGEATGQRVRIRAPLFRNQVGELFLDRSDLLFASPEINPGLEAAMPRVGVWRLRRSRATE